MVGGQEPWSDLCQEPGGVSVLARTKRNYEKLGFAEVIQEGKGQPEHSDSLPSLGKMRVKGLQG